MLMQIAHQSCLWILHTQPALQAPVQHRLVFCRGAARSNRYTTAVRARKKAELAEEWASLARDDQLSDEEDPELQRSINEVCNKGLRYMLRGETNRLLDYRDELSRFGQYFSDRNNVAGATFIYVVYKMTEHILPKQMVSLEGIYLEAFRKMFGMLEDSGWQLSSEPEEGEELDLLEEPTEEDLQQLGYTVTE